MNLPGRSSVVLPLLGGRALSSAVCAALGVQDPSTTVDEFPDGELHVSIREAIRGRRVHLLQSLSAPVGERLLALVLAADAARRAGAAAVTAILPYMAYARQDRRRFEGDPLGAAVVADVLGTCHLERLVLIDLHTASVEGVFSTPVEHLTAEPLLTQALRSRVGEDGVIIAPDLGAAKLARRYGKRLGLPVAIVHKARIGPREVAAEQLVGEVRDRRPVIVDDMISTGGTVVAAVEAVLKAGGRPDVLVAATHAVFSPGWRRVLATGVVRHVLVTDTVEGPPESDDPRVERISIAPLLADVVRRLDADAPLGDLLSSS